MEYVAGRVRIEGLSLYLAWAYYRVLGVNRFIVAALSFLCLCTFFAFPLSIRLRFSFAGAPSGAVGPHSPHFVLDPDRSRLSQSPGINLVEDLLPTYLPHQRAAEIRRTRTED